MILNSLDKKITIDCEYMNATEEEGLTSVNNKVNGYPIYLKPGDNIVNVVPGTDSTFNNLVIKYRGTWIWLEYMTEILKIFQIMDMEY